MNSENLITVLMSSYNGERYIREQIDSILHQQEVNIKLFVRDDGSTDGTLQILKEYQEAGLLNFYTGKNLKPARSFMQLLKDAPQADYYAFSDQDDYWQKDKIKTAIDHISSKTDHKYLLYCSQTRLADKELHPIGTTKKYPLLTFEESLIYKYANGCTMVFNHALRNKIIAYEPDFLPMHDCWILSIALGLKDSQVIFDDTSHILYRQHENNVIGQNKDQWNEWKRRYKQIFLMHEHERSSMAREILKGYSKELTPQSNVSLRTFLKGKKDFCTRMKIIADGKFTCADKHSQRLFRIAVLLNTY